CIFNYVFQSIWYKKPVNNLFYNIILLIYNHISYIRTGTHYKKRYIGDYSPTYLFLINLILKFKIKSVAPRTRLLIYITFYLVCNCFLIVIIFKRNLYVFC